jgi:adenosylmethionine-8-amino-7-oxononanoate aminotransferase
MVSKRTEELLALDRKYLIHGFSVVGDEDVGPIVERAEGIRCWDTEGRAYFDAGSQQTSNTLGHGQRDIIDAICEQAQKLQFAHVLAKQSNVPILEYARDFAQVVPPTLQHFYFTSGGSEAVETAFKLARLYWSKQGKGKYKIISIQDSYHGAGMGSAAATRAGGGAFWAGYAPLASGFIQAPYFYCNRCPFHLEYPSCKVLCARYVEEIIKKEGVDSVAAYIAEPVMGAAGNIAPPPEYFPIIRQICDAYDVFLIGDEVQTGFGRTGKMWAYEHWDVRWDMMTVAKAIDGCYLPFGATLISDRIYQGLRGAMLWHGWTQQGNPICAAAAKAALKLISRDKLVQNAEMVGSYVLKRLNKEFKALPNVSDIGGKGLMLGIEVVKNKATGEPFDSATMSKWQKGVLQKGLYVRLALAKDYSRVRFNPPIITTREEADEMLDILYKALADLK